MASYGTVLVGSDGSQSASKAVDRAAEVARDAGAKLLIATAYHPMTERERERAAAELGEEVYKVTGSHPAEDVLSEAKDRAHAAGAKDVETLCREGDPVDLLVDLIGEHSVDLVVVGNRGLNSLAGRILGSVPANISHRASCDVLIVHTTAGRFR